MKKKDKIFELVVQYAVVIFIFWFLVTGMTNCSKSIHESQQMHEFYENDSNYQDYLDDKDNYYR